MMIMRRRPLLRAAAVGGGTYLAGKHVARQRADQQYQEAAQDERINELEQQQAAGVQPAAGQGAAPTMTEQLGKLADLYRQGVLSDAEFAAAKAKLLGG